MKHLNLKPVKSVVIAISISSLLISSNLQAHNDDGLKYLAPLIVYSLLSETHYNKKQYHHKKKYRHGRHYDRPRRHSHSYDRYSHKRPHNRKHRH